MMAVHPAIFWSGVGSCSPMHALNCCLVCARAGKPEAHRITASATAPAKARAVTDMNTPKLVVLSLVGGRQRRDLDIPAFDFFLQRLYHIGNALQPRIDGERAAIDFQRLFVVADILHDEAEARQ